MLSEIRGTVNIAYRAITNGLKNDSIIILSTKSVNWAMRRYLAMVTSKALGLKLVACAKLTRFFWGTYLLRSYFCNRSSAFWNMICELSLFWSLQSYYSSAYILPKIIYNNYEKITNFSEYRMVQK